MTTRDPYQQEMLHFLLLVWGGVGVVVTLAAVVWWLVL